MERGTQASAGRIALTLLLIVLSIAATAAPVPASPASEAQRLRTQLEDIRRDFREAGAAYDAAYWELDETEVRINEIDAQIEQTEGELLQARQLLGARLDRMYRSDSVDYLSVLLGAASFQEMVTRLDFVQRIGQADAAAIVAVETLQTQLAEERRTLEAERASREAALGELRAQRDALQSRLSAKQAEYERAQAALNAALRAASGTRATTSAAPGANGMVFPVQGACYYSDTWGASRSGGRRRHQGTDIMAARGTPCVAVLSGSVRAKNNTLGGRTIWLTADNGWTFYYAHLDSWAVQSGRVSAGQVIGYVGSTGNASASSPHLHFEIHPGGGGAVNPYPYLRAMQ